jgi:hypothetical protein
VLDVDAGDSGAIVAGSGSASVTISGTLAQVQALLDADATSSVFYTANSDAPPASATLDVTVDDGVTQATASRAIAIIPVNDAPAMDLDPGSGGSDAAAAYIIGSAPVALAPGAVFDDPDNAAAGEFDGATLTVSIAANGTVDDRLRVTSTGTGTGEVSVSGNTISYEGTGVATFTGGTGGSDLVITFNEFACHCAIQTVMEQVNFALTGLASLDRATHDRVRAHRRQRHCQRWRRHRDRAGDRRHHRAAERHDRSARHRAGWQRNAGQHRDGGCAAERCRRQAVGQRAMSSSWQGNGSGDDAGIFVQRFDAAGAPVGGETLVNTTTVGGQSEPSIAALTDGGYVVTWQGGTGVDAEIFAQRFDASGAAFGTEFLVNTSISGLQVAPSVAALADGGWIVAWTYTGASIVLTQRYDASGTPVGSETLSPNGQASPVVLGLADGGYALAVVAEVSLDTYSIYVWRFAADGSPAWGPIEVNPTDYAGNPSLAELADGRLVVTLDGLGPGDDGDVFVQIVSADGALVSSATNIGLGGNQSAPVVTALGDGGFVVGWYGSGPDGYGVYAWRFDESGSPLGDRFLIDADTFGTNLALSVAALDDGFVAAWQGKRQWRRCRDLRPALPRQLQRHRAGRTGSKGHDPRLRPRHHRRRDGDPVGRLRHADGRPGRQRRHRHLGFPQRGRAGRHRRRNRGAAQFRPQQRDRLYLRP